ncbi:putative Neuferricin [Hypsibius exemplaris]|uniref:Neuferricin n=1 Tax=Hypsibius exemplaris TaxID=2072580 RepID=A0A1W0X019_HYPEX|nr:putative Neuferricin [Hypsibius exemplaris]
MEDSVRRRVGEREAQTESATSQTSTDFSDEDLSDSDFTPVSEGDGKVRSGILNPLKVVLILTTALAVFLLFRDQSSFLRTLDEPTGSPVKSSKSSGEGQTGKTVVNGITIWAKEELAKFTGVDEKLPVLLAYMGKVYDVSKGRRHYGPGGSYQFFSGKDATRSFLTGDFKNDLTDNLDGIAESSYGDIENWDNTYSKSADYKQVGVLCGYFYQCVGDKNPGQPTEKLLHVERMAAKSKVDAAKENEIFVEFPQCNSEWSQEKGGRVWCSDKSGGIDRNWSGLPRLFLTQKDGKKSTRCACVHPDKVKDPRVELYPSCPPDADSCKLQQ